MFKIHQKQVGLKLTLAITLQHLVQRESHIIAPQFQISKNREILWSGEIGGGVLYVGFSAWEGGNYRVVVVRGGGRILSSCGV